MIYVCGFIGMLTSGCLAVVGNEDISVAASACFAYFSRLLENLGVFLGNSSIPLIKLQGIVETAADDALQIFNNTGYVRTSADAIIDSFGDFMTLHVMGLAGNEEDFSSIRQSFSANVEPVVGQIQGMLDTLETDLYEGRGMINDALSTAVSQIESFRNKTTLWQFDVNTYEGEEWSIRAYRKGAILALFVVGGAVCLGGLIGILTSRKPRCYRLHSLMNLTGIISALLGSVCLVIASLTLLVSFVWHDACEISQYIISDFEPIVGETIARGANAIFDGTNLAVAFNVTDKIDFEEKLNAGLFQIQSVSIPTQFRLVVSPLEDMQEVVDTVSSLSFDAFQTLSNNAANFPPATPGLDVCRFSDRYYKGDMREPWQANRPNTNTAWLIESTGTTGTYARVDDESMQEYIDRIYSVAGMCNDDNSGDCCLNGSCSLSKDAPCNSGSKCALNVLCDESSKGIRESFALYQDAYEMGANLGVECPAGISCPTAEFEAEGHDDTLIGLVTAYGDNITETADSLVNIATTSVGTAMDEVRIFLCNMDVSFVADGYIQVRDEVCVTMLGGFSQINWGLWALGFWLEIIALLANILATRLRGHSIKDVEANSYTGDKSFRNHRHTLTRPEFNDDGV